MNQQETERNAADYWVGKFTDSLGRVFVYDPAIQFANSPFVYLYLVSALQVRKFDREKTRQQVVKIELPDAAEYAIQAYEKWKRVVGEKIRVDGRYRLPTLAPSSRASGCWQCKVKLDGEFDIECKKCGWMICPNCGACDPNCGSKLKKR